LLAHEHGNCVVSHSKRLSHYRLEGEIGHGGMGVVYRAVDEVLDRPVALKVIHFSEFCGRAEANTLRDRFRHEAKLAARLNHPGLVTIYALERVGDLDLIAMELVEGETLAHRLARGVRWSPEEAAALIAVLADAVQAAHSAGIIHRDLKPANIMVLPNGRTKVLDFGVAKALAGQLGADRTVAGTVFGTVAYMAPEQVLGGQLTAACDVFALGAVLYEVVTGERAFGQGSPVVVGSRVVNEVPPSIADPDGAAALFGPVWPLLQRALDKDPQQRLGDAGTLRDALARAVPGVLVSPIDESGSLSAPFFFSSGTGLRSGLSTPRTSPPRAPAVLLVGLVFALAVTALGSVYYLLSMRPPPPDGGGFTGAALTPVASGSTRFDTGPEPTAETDKTLPEQAAADVSQRQVVGGVATGSAERERARSASSGRATEAQPVPLPPPPGDSGLRRATSAILPEPVTGHVATQAQGGKLARLDGPGRAASPGTASDKKPTLVADSAEVQVASAPASEPQSHPNASRPVLATVSFTSNVKARVYLALAGDAALQMAGTTDFHVALPVGRYRIVFKAPYQGDWQQVEEFPKAGQAYSVSKTYVTYGRLLVTVAGGWANVSLNGGPSYQTPHLFEHVPVGEQTVRAWGPELRDTLRVKTVVHAGTLTQKVLSWFRDRR
jgi:serine/threonine protein kinase